MDLLGEQRLITCSNNSALRGWNPESSLQIGDDWRDKEDGVGVIAVALSPRGDIVTSDEMVGLWNSETGKISAKWTGHTRNVLSASWSLICARVVSGSDEGTVRVCRERRNYHVWSNQDGT